MLNSEKAMFAFNDVKDEYLESASSLLGYKTGRDKRHIGK